MSLMTAHNRYGYTLYTRGMLKIKMSVFNVKIDNLGRYAPEVDIREICTRTK